MKAGSQVNDRESIAEAFSVVEMEFMLSCEVEFAKNVIRSFDCMCFDSNDCGLSPLWFPFGGEGLGVGSHFHNVEKFIESTES